MSLNPIKSSSGFKSIVMVVLLAFAGTMLGPLPLAQADDFRLPAPGVMVHLSPPLDPPMLKGIKVHPDNPFRFEFILDKGDNALSNDQLKDESSKLIKYFLASLTIPENDLWVNLSPYEKDRIIPQSFGLTEMGRDLLAEDYMLKQITASLIYPEDEVGRKFWKRIYEEAQKRYGTTNIPVNTFNKVWIVPEKAVVFENAKAGTAYVVESKLKVMLEQDYLSLEKHEGIQSVQPQAKDTNQLGSQVVREIVIPELTREVNENRNFVKLRQVYNSLILATWYKKKIKDSILEQVYADKNKVAGVNVDDPKEKGRIYQKYLRAFKKGVFNYIKEDVDPGTQETIPRKYFSGGAVFGNLDRAMNITESSNGIDNKTGLIEISSQIDAAMARPLNPQFAEIIGGNSITDPRLLRWLGNNRRWFSDKKQLQERLSMWLESGISFIPKSEIIRISPHGSDIIQRLLEGDILGSGYVPIKFSEEDLLNLQKNGIDIDNLLNDLKENGYVKEIQPHKESPREKYVLHVNFFIFGNYPDLKLNKHYGDDQKKRIFNFLKYHFVGGSGIWVPNTSVDIDEKKVHEIVTDESDFKKVMGILQKTVPGPRFVAQAIQLIEFWATSEGDDRSVEFISEIGEHYDANVSDALVALAKLSMRGHAVGKEGGKYLEAEDKLCWLLGYNLSELQQKEVIQKLNVARSNGNEAATYALGVIVANNYEFTASVADFRGALLFAADKGSKKATASFIGNIHIYSNFTSPRLRKIKEAEETIDEIIGHIDQIQVYKDRKRYAEWMDDFSNFVVQLTELASDRESLSKLLRVYYHWSNLNIFRPMFWPEELRSELIKNRQDNERNQLPSEKPLAVVVYPKADHNGAFMATTLLKDVVKRYTVLYYEAESTEDMVRALKNATKHQKASLVVIGGHGTTNSIQFGKHHRLTVNYKNILEAADLNHILSPGATGVLESCSTGGCGVTGGNIAQMLAGIFDAKFFAPTKDGFLKKLQYDDEGKIVGVEYGSGDTTEVQTYRALPINGRKIGDSAQTSSEWRVVDGNAFFRHATQGEQKSVVDNMIRLDYLQQYGSTTADREYLTNALNKLWSQFIFVLTSQGHMVGFASVSHSRGHLSYMAVDDQFRRSGIGTLLLKRIFDYYHGKGINNVDFTSAGKDSDRFYKKVFQVYFRSHPDSRFNEKRTKDHIKIDINELYRLQPEFKDRAMVQPVIKGGIDFTASKTPLEIQNAGAGIKFHLDPAMLKKLQDALGFVPVIINIQPMNNLRSWLGLVDNPRVN